MKVAWITGASSGIGRELALRLARDGWTVAASARNASVLQDLSEAMQDRIHAFPVDVTDRSAVAATLSLVEETLGEISLAVFGAGTYTRETAETFDTLLIGEMVDLNLMGTVHCLEAVMRRMLPRRRGHIAVMASVSGYTGLPGAAGYGATKAALINMCEALYPELKEKGVQLSLINPGFVDTPLTRMNDFPMPFMISAEAAADHIARGLRAGKFEIAFPWKMALAMKMLSALPARIRFAITRRMLREEE
ncbi:SDR family NAD(P)-dependent oxidoreductase [Rhizobiaceae bacterium n13]|uniref:SDR family NAD(P)-dependent oxidoreductase n=1 Tax=Ferirhizobium litorale TaxID=2927786 RepID=A0AAE3U2U3_9HYPH|nr:SDR family NAD(P)-dependent oxidoreductase [Fererhizobium litorale]MDI7862626.1 SDR family NAD(P)-dependent oxidoreductase [Fererhizobium litorale]MDI7923891.1 SDR family NAD(P)-dependent oxidoreductase [Fererhizobium litorale]